MAVYGTGKIEGSITVTGSGTQNGSANINVHSQIKANYDQTNLTDFIICDKTETITSTFDEDGKLNGGNGITYNLSHTATDTAIGGKFTVTGKWTIKATGNTVTITKNFFSVTTEKI